MSLNEGIGVAEGMAVGVADGECCRTGVTVETAEAVTVKGEKVHAEHVTLMISKRKIR